MIGNNRIGKNRIEIEFDEIFSDSQNRPGFHQESLEGALENPVTEKVFILLGIILAIFSSIFIFRIAFLQLAKGSSFKFRSENNYLRIVYETKERGKFYDRRGKVLATSELADGKWRRRYPPAGFLHVLGYLGRGEDGQLHGTSGLEAVWEEILKGKASKNAQEIDAKGSVVDAGLLEKGENGKNILLTIDFDLQLRLSAAIESLMKSRGFSGGAGIIMDVTNGDVVALVSLPEFNPNMLAEGTEEKIRALTQDQRKPFFNRAISGLYPPGSIVKPALAAGALAEGLILPEKEILSAGTLILPNPYDALRPNLFPDWKAHGWVNMRQALALSSNIYFYVIGGGYESQKGLGVWNIKKYFEIFGFGKQTGVDLFGEKRGTLPDPQRKQNGRDWSIGDTYHLSIGQGNILVTPIQMAAYAAYIASYGKVYYPHLVKAVLGQNMRLLEKLNYPQKETFALEEKIFSVIHEGMRQAVNYGTAKGLGGLGVSVAAKTGTAEIGDTDKVHSWSIGFLPASPSQGGPADKPRLAFAILLEEGPRNNLVGATYAASETIRWMVDTNFLSELDNDILKK